GQLTRIGAKHEFFVQELRHRPLAGGSAGLPDSRGSVRVLSRSPDYFAGRASRTSRCVAVPAGHRHNPQCYVAHGRGDDGGHCGLEQHSHRRVHAADASPGYRTQGSRGGCISSASAAGADDVAGDITRADPDGSETRNRQRSLRAAGSRHYRRAAGFGRGNGLSRSRCLSLGSPRRGNHTSRGDSVRLKLVFLIGILSAAPCLAQSPLILQNPSDAPVDALGVSADEQASGHEDTSLEGQASSLPQFKPNNTFNLSVKDAEAIALKNNPAISVARLNAMASQQVTREVRSSFWPTAYANLTGVDAYDDSRISAGGLNNPVIYARAAAGATVSQLITDFGHTTNLVASARLHAKAEDQNARATKEDVLLTVDQAFYNALQAQAVLKVARQTVDSRQLLTDQVSALTRSKLKSDLDLSFADVNLAQAKLLQLDAENNEQAAFAGLSAVLGFPTVQNIVLVEDTEPLVAPAGNPDQLIAEAFSQRPEILALEFESE